MLRLTYSADENSKGEVPLVCLQHYQTAEPSGAKGVYVHTHTHTHLGFMANCALTSLASDFNALCLYLSLVAAFALPVCI